MNKQYSINNATGYEFVNETRKELSASIIRYASKLMKLFE